ncbi:unnamed protein product [Cunninghamella blakesleeana]
MVGMKSVLLTFGLLLMIIMEVSAVKRSLPRRSSTLLRRDDLQANRDKCGLACSDSQCQTRCDNENIGKVVLSVCYENNCYCGFAPK